jgi:hypothetical protein
MPRAVRFAARSRFTSHFGRVLADGFRFLQQSGPATKSRSSSAYPFAYQQFQTLRFLVELFKQEPNTLSMQ